MPSKQASILDFPHPGLSPEVWDEDGNLQSQHKEIILSTLTQLLEEAGLSHSDEWIDEISIIGSITTYQYVSTSDIDIHIFTDLDKFIKLERPTFDHKAAAEYLDNLRWFWNETMGPLPGTKHPIEFYFDTPFATKPEKRVTGVYNIKSDTWEKPPVVVSMDFDIEEMKPFLVDMANTLAQEFDISLGDIKRQVERIEELQEVMAAWPEDKRKVFQKKIDERIEAIDTEITDLVALREKVIQDRKDYKPESQQEINFKYLQRFGYLFLVGQFKDLLEQVTTITEETISDVKEIVSEASLELTAEHENFWIHPDGKVMPIQNKDHNKFVVEHADELLNGEVPKDYNGVMRQMFKMGWTRAIVTPEAIYLQNELSGVPEYLDTFIWDHWQDKPGFAVYYNNPKIGDRTVIDVSEGLEKGLRKSRPLSAALAEEFPGEGKLFIDYDHTLVSDDKVLEGAKEALEKFKKDGWEIVIYSCRAQEASGVPDLKALLEKFDLPFDDIFVGKPFAQYYIDDHALQFTTWKEIAGKVTKEARLITAWMAHAYWIAPDGQTFEVRGAEDSWYNHTQWVQEHVDILDKYGINTNALVNDVEPNYEDVDAIFKEMYGKGWARIGDSSDNIWAVTVQAVQYVPNGVEDVLAKFLPPGGQVEISDQEGVFVVVEYPFNNLQKEINRQLMQKRQVAKKAKIIEIDLPYVGAPLKVIVNPTHNEALGAIKRAEHGLRYLKDDDGNMFIWDSWNATHDEVAEKLIESGYHVSNTDAAGLLQDESSVEDMFGLVAKQAQKGVDYDYSSTHVCLPKHIASKVIEWGKKNIPDEHVYSDETGRYGREKDSHVTVKYGLLTNDAAAVKKLFAEHKPVRVKFGKTRFFSPPNGLHDVVVIDVSSEDLHALNKAVEAAFESDDLYPNYEPHATVAYVLPGHGKHYQGQDVLGDVELILNEVIFAPKEGEDVVCPLGPEQEKKADFSPSIATSPADNDWQFSQGGPDVEIATQPQDISDEETYYQPPADKPRPKSFWERFIALITGTKKTAAYNHAYWIDPAGKVYTVREAAGSEVEPSTTHSRWILDNLKLLHETYGYPENSINSTDDLVRKGWTRIGDGFRTEWGVTVADLKHLNPAIDTVLAQFVPEGTRVGIASLGHWDDYAMIEWPVKSVQQAVLQSLQRQRMQQPAVASVSQLARFFREAEKEDQIEVQALLDEGRHSEAALLIEKAIGIEADGEVAEILKSVQETGGATYNMSRGNVAGQKLFAVATHPDRAVILNEPPTEESLNQYLSQNRDLLDADTSLGVWVNNGKTYLDIVTTIPDREKAIELGKANNQIAIFDLSNFQEIPTGGTGEVKTTAAPVGNNYTPAWEDEEDEPYTPLPVTVDMKTNDKNLGQPGVRRFMGKPDGEYHSNEGDVDDVLIKNVEKEDKESSMSILKIEPYGGGPEFPVFVNPSKKQAENLIKKTKTGGVRIIVGNATYIWDAYQATHDHVLEYLVGQGFEEYSQVQTGYLSHLGDANEWTWKSSSMRLSRLDKKAYSSIGTNKYWITPNQKIVQIGTTEMHIDWVAHHLKEVYNSGTGVEDLDQPIASYKGRYFDDLSDNDQATLEHIMNDMQLNGWVRISTDDTRTQFVVDGGKMGFGSGTDQFIAEHFDPHAKKPIGVFWKGGSYLEVWDPFPTLMQAYQKAAKSPAAKKWQAKQASAVERVGDTRVFIDPTFKQAVLLMKDSKYGEVRGIVSPITGELFIWDANELTHENVVRNLGIDIDPYSDEESDLLSVMSDESGLRYMFELQQMVRSGLHKASLSTWTGPAFRVDTGYTHDSDVTALDVIKYETEALGNDLGVDRADLDKVLAQTSARNLVWVTHSLKEAMRYGPKNQVQKFDLPAGSLIVGEDGDGGHLVLLPSSTKAAGNESTCYTDEEMEKIYDDQHAQDGFGDTPGGGNVYHDWNQDTSQFPKVPGPYKVRLDILQNPADRRYPPQDTPPYDVPFYEGMPADDDGPM